MGNWCSGRHGSKVIVEDGLVLDLARLMRLRIVRPDVLLSGEIVWRNVRTKERTSTIGYEANLIGPGTGTMRLRYVKTLRGGEKVHCDYTVRLETTPLHFGGVRWWFICPRTGRRAAKLYLPNGAHRFACRQAFPKAYRSQNAGGLDETHMRIGRAMEKLGGTYRYPGEPAPRKPKWMRWKTYDRLAAKVGAAQELHEAVFMAGCSRISGRLAKLDARRR